MIADSNLARSLVRNLDQVLSSSFPLGMDRRSVVCFLLLLAIVSWFWEPLAVLYALTQRQENSSHIVFIPWLCLYVFYLDLKVVISSRDWSPWLGSILIGLGASGYWLTGPVADGADHLSKLMLAFVMSCWGAFLFCYGIRSCRICAFGLLLLLFMVPLPTRVLDGIIVFLQHSSAEVTALLFSVLHVPVLREGFVFSLSEFTIYVAEECSGLRSFIALVITSLVAGHWLLTSGWAKTALVVVVVPLAIIKNAFRIVGLALLANYVDPSYITDSELHRNGGIPFFLFSLVVLLGIVLILRRWEGRLTIPSGSVRDGHA